MTPQIKTGIIEFLANEFKMAPDQLTGDLLFSADLGLSPVQFQDLLQRLQDSLSFILPEDRAASINSVSDLLEATEEEDHDEP